MLSPRPPGRWTPGPNPRAKPPRHTGPPWKSPHPRANGPGAKPLHPGSARRTPRLPLPPPPCADPPCNCRGPGPSPPSPPSLTVQGASPHLAESSFSSSFLFCCFASLAFFALSCARLLFSSSSSFPSAEFSKSFLSSATDLFGIAVFLSTLFSLSKS